jgi:hypothetical protein
VNQIADRAEALSRPPELLLISRLFKVAAPCLVMSMLGLAGCTQTVPVYDPAFENVQLLKAASARPASVDKFSGGPTSLIIRGFTSAKSPVGNDFGDYVQDALSRELDKAQLLVMSSDYKIQGKVVDTDVDTGISTGRTSISVEFVVTKEGVERYRKVVTSGYEWDSSFIGALAIPRGIQSYPKVVGMLLNKLYSDPDFAKALR